MRWPYFIRNILSISGFSQVSRNAFIDDRFQTSRQSSLIEFPRTAPAHALHFTSPIVTSTILSFIILQGTNILRKAMNIRLLSLLPIC